MEAALPRTPPHLFSSKCSSYLHQVSHPKGIYKPPFSSVCRNPTLSPTLDVVPQGRMESFRFDGTNDLRCSSFSCLTGKCGRRIAFPFALRPSPLILPLRDAVASRGSLFCESSPDKAGSFRFFDWIFASISETSNPSCVLLSAPSLSSSWTVVPCRPFLWHRHQSEYVFSPSVPLWVKGVRVFLLPSRGRRLLQSILSSFDGLSVGKSILLRCIFPPGSRTSWKAHPFVADPNTSVEKLFPSCTGSFFFP